MSAHADDIAKGERFAFGENWARFLEHLDEDRIRLAEDSLRHMLRVDSLAGKSFLDIGSGSGLFSLVARRLGARVRSFDYDPQSVACTLELKRRYFPEDPSWDIHAGNALDGDFIASLGRFDVVYSWGVLHHTGNMWLALANAVTPVAPGGQLFIAIYNDQGWRSKVWRLLKKAHCRNVLGRWAVTALGSAYFGFVCLKEDLVRLRNPLRRYRDYKNANRGMSILYDWIDWFGGYPFEVASPTELVDFHTDKGFVLTRLRTVGGALGCNEFVFRLEGSPSTTYLNSSSVSASQP
jgi:2-polyprenyl-6-hydroxyphenyl methylase/3-demethylubiquinone-9 3-methyltransferase